MKEATMTSAQRERLRDILVRCLHPRIAERLRDNDMMLDAWCADAMQAAEHGESCFEVPRHMTRDGNPYLVGVDDLCDVAEVADDGEAVRP